jgi:hypothetical protein
MKRTGGVGQAGWKVADDAVRQGRWDMLAGRLMVIQTGRAGQDGRKVASNVDTQGST